MKKLQLENNKNYSLKSTFKNGYVLITPYFKKDLVETLNINYNFNDIDQNKIDLIFNHFQSLDVNFCNTLKSYKNDILKGKVSYLPNELIKFWWVNNNGLLSICYAASRKKVKKLYLFGFNFYHSGYMNNSIEGEVEHLYPGHSKLLKNARQKLKKNFIKIVRSFPNKKFYIFLYKDLFKKKPRNLIVKIVK